MDLTEIQTQKLAGEQCCLLSVKWDLWSEEQKVCGSENMRNLC